MDNQKEIIDPYRKILEKNFGIKYLYPFQRLVVTNIAETAYVKNLLSEDCHGIREYLNLLNSDSVPDERDTRPNQMVILPTGAGKSLCFMLPSLFLKNLTVIVFPLLSLIDDQYRRCQEAGINAAVLKGGLTKQERFRIFNKIENNEIRILLTNPENLQNSDFSDHCKNKLNHFVIDEAHTISQWGDSFRPAYKEITGFIRKTEPDIITAFTATASSAILKRIGETVFPDNGYHFISQLPDRKNIFYSVRNPINKILEIVKVISDPNNLPAIVFCSSRTGAEITARRLRLYTGNQNIIFYHAGLSAEEKSKIEKWFFSSRNGILCATCAYGMGVDKKDIHTVIHFNLPSTIEAYLQESGRAGRDGAKALSIVLDSEPDTHKNTAPEGIGLIFRENKKCRRKLYLSLLDQEIEFCHGCDVCSKSLYTDNRQEQQLKRFIKTYNGNFTVDEATGILLGRVHSAEKLCSTGTSVRYFGLLYDWDEKELKDFLTSKNMNSCAFISKSGLWKNRVLSGNRSSKHIKRTELILCSIFYKFFNAITVFLKIIIKRIIKHN